MKKTIKKLLICILIICILSNFCATNVSFAAGNAIGDWLKDKLSSVVGLLTYPVRLIAVTLATAVDNITKEVAYSQGGIDPATGQIVPGTFVSSEMITPFDIFFNKIALLDVNFFNIANDGSIISNIRTAVAGWYYVMRLIASAILLCILIYVGIRMAISTIASDKAAYKKMLVDWVCSLAIIFLLQYIILFTFAVNEAFINGLQSIDNGEELVNAMLNIKKLALDFWDMDSIAATIVFCMLAAQTLALIFSYFNRMLKIAFLIIISPLITLTYSIDKMGDGKAQALGTWLKEFVYTVLLQTFHCIIYMAFISMAIKIFESGGANNGTTIAGTIITVFCVKFTKDAEKILGKIFKFSDATSDSSLAVGMAASAMALSKAKSIGKTTRSAINGVKNLNIGGRMRTAKVEALAIGSMIAGKKNAEGKRMNFAEAKDDANAKVTNKEADKIEKKLKVDRSTGSKYEEAVKTRQTELEKTGMTASLAAATARAEIAKKTRTDEKKSKKQEFYNKHRTISKAVSFGSAVKSAGQAAWNSETGKFLRDMGSATISAGVGTFAGSSTYGVSGNAFNAFALGAASYKGTQEFLKSSSGTLVNNAADIHTGMGAKSKEDVAKINRENDVLSPILGNDKAFDDKCKELVKFVEDAVKDLNFSDSQKDGIKTTVRNTVASNLKKDPTISNDALLGKIQGDLQNAYGTDISNRVTSNANYNGSVGQLIHMQRHKDLYDVRQNANNLGIHSDTFERMVGKKFTGVSSSSGYHSNGEVLSSVTHGSIDSDGNETRATSLTVSDLDRLAEYKTDTDMSALKRKFENELDRIQDKIDNGGLSADKQKELIDQERRVAESLQAMNDREINAKMQEYQAEYDQLCEKFRTETEADAQRQINAEITRIRQECENYLSGMGIKMAGDVGVQTHVGTHDYGITLIDGDERRNTQVLRTSKGNESVDQKNSWRNL